jgi:GTPase
MSHDDDIHISHEPHDRLTNLCDQMAQVLHEPGNEDIKGIILLDDGEMGGIMQHGYDDQLEAFVDLYTHLKAMAHTVGLHLDFVSVPESPEGI